MRDEIDTLLNDCEKALEILKCEVSIVENNKTCYNISEHPVSLSSLDGTSAFSSRDAHKVSIFNKDTHNVSICYLFLNFELKGR